GEEMTKRWHQVLTARAARVTAAVTLGTAVVSLAAASPSAAVAAPRADSAATASQHGATSPGPASPAGSLPTNVKRACPSPPPTGKAACLVLKRTDITGRIGAYPAAATPSGYGPGDFANAYKLPGGSAGQGETVALVDAFDDPNAAADLAVYRQQYGLPAC